MTAALRNHLWQSTLFAVAAGIVTWALRRNGAHVRHAVWMAASVKFLVPFSVLLAVGRWLPAAAPAPVTTPQSSAAAIAPDFAVVVDQIAQPFTRVFEATAATGQPGNGANWIALAVVAIWICGVVAVGASWFRAWWRVRVALRASHQIAVALEIPVRSSAGLLEPGVVGLWRPVLLVPEGLERHLTPRQLDTVFAHELCHVRRRDNLTAAIHMIVESVFWFHPVVWWIGARLVDERERACDEHVLRAGGEPQVYAESILSVCRLYVESPLACVSGVTGSDLKRRVAAIMINRIGAQLTVGRKVALSVVVMLAITLPLVAGMVTAPLHAANQSALAAKFDVVSVKPCDPKAPLPARDPAPPGGRSGISPWAARTSPGYVLWACVTLPKLIEQAYADADHPLLNTPAQLPPHSKQSPHVRGGPDWVDTDTFTIEATAPVDVTNPALAGAAFRGLSSLPPAMSRALQVMLEDRFQLKVHRATEEAEVYAMTVGKSGINKTTLTTPVPGDCRTREQYFADAALTPPDPRVNARICGTGYSKLEGTEYTSVTMATLAKDLVGFLDRFVINRTGLEGAFNFELKTGGGVRQVGSGDSISGDERINRGLQDLGLRIDLVKAPVEYFAIDRVQRPRPNAPAEIVARPARALGAGQPR